VEYKTRFFNIAHFLALENFSRVTVSIQPLEFFHSYDDILKKNINETKKKKKGYDSPSPLFPGWP